MPAVFPVLESDVFLLRLFQKKVNHGYYTSGILLALDFLQMTFDELSDILKQVMPQLNDKVIISKSTLNQTLAE